MLERLEAIEERYNKLNELLSDPEVISDTDKLRDYSKEQSDLEPAVSAYRKYRTADEELQGAQEMLQEKLDKDMADMVKEEVAELEAEISTIEEELKVLLLPKDPNDDKNDIVEIRAAAGGDEAGLFAGDLYRMYARFAEAKRWNTEVME